MSDISNINKKILPVQDELKNILNTNKITNGNPIIDGQFLYAYDEKLSFFDRGGQRFLKITTNSSEIPLTQEQILETDFNKLKGSLNIFKTESGISMYYTDSSGETFEITQGSGSSGNPVILNHNDLLGREEENAHPISAITGLESALNEKVNVNTAIVAGTNTKISYDEKGLVTGATAATLDDIWDGTYRKLSNYVSITRTVNGQPLSDDVTVTATDVGLGTDSTPTFAGIELGAGDPIWTIDDTEPNVLTFKDGNDTRLRIKNDGLYVNNSTTPLGSGTVTSVEGTSPIVVSSGTTPTISLKDDYGDLKNPYASKAAKLFLATPNASADVPSFRAIVPSDIPALNYITKTASRTPGYIPTWGNTDGGSLNNGYSVETTLTGGNGAIPRADAVKTYVDGILAANDAMVFKGTIGSGGTYEITAFNNLTTYNAGWTYKVITAGTIKGKVAEYGDLVMATVDRTGTDAVYSDWIVTQTNIDGAVVGPANTVGDNNVAVFSGTTGKRIKDSTVSFETVLSSTSNSKIPTSKAVSDYVTGLKYAGSSSAGGSANSVANALTIGAGLSGTVSTYNGSVAVTISHADPSSQSDVTNTGNTVIQSIGLDAYGHIDSIASKEITLAGLGYVAPTINNGKLTLAVSGVGLSGSESFYANQSGNSSFTVTSNATSINTPSTIVSRGTSGEFSAGAVTTTALNVGTGSDTWTIDDTTTTGKLTFKLGSAIIELDGSNNEETKIIAFTDNISPTINNWDDREWTNIPNSKLVYNSLQTNYPEIIDLTGGS